MSSISKTILIGNLGDDPDVRTTHGGKVVARLSVATSRSWKNKQSGEKETETEWHRVVFFDRLAEVCRDYLKKGSKIYIEGFNKTTKYQDNNGNDRWSTDVVGREMHMLDSKGQGQSYQQAPQQNQAPSQPQGQPDYSDFDDTDVTF